jgi:hypothetical protein
VLRLSKNEGEEELYIYIRTISPPTIGGQKQVKTKILETLMMTEMDVNQRMVFVSTGYLLLLCECLYTKVQIGKSTSWNLDIEDPRLYKVLQIGKSTSWNLDMEDPKLYLQ